MKKMKNVMYLLLVLVLLNTLRLVIKDFRRSIVENGSYIISIGVNDTRRLVKFSMVISMMV